jgi:hypothetical protein
MAAGLFYSEPNQPIIVVGSSVSRLRDLGAVLTGFREI